MLWRMLFTVLSINLATECQAFCSQAFCPLLHSSSIQQRNPVQSRATARTIHIRGAPLSKRLCLQAASRTGTSGANSADKLFAEVIALYEDVARSDQHSSSVDNAESRSRIKKLIEAKRLLETVFNLDAGVAASCQYVVTNVTCMRPVDRYFIILTTTRQFFVHMSVYLTKHLRGAGVWDLGVVRSKHFLFLLPRVTLHKHNHHLQRKLWNALGNSVGRWSGRNRTRTWPCVCRWQVSFVLRTCTCTCTYGCMCVCMYVCESSRKRAGYKSSV